MTILATLNIFLPYGAAATERILVNALAIGTYTTILTILMYRTNVRESQHKTRSELLLQQMPVGVAIVDPDLRLEYANPRLQELYGGPLEEMVGRPATLFVHSEDVRLVMSDRDWWRRRETSNFKLRLNRSDGTNFEALVSLMPFERESRFDGVLAIVVDISEAKFYRAQTVRLENLTSFLLDAVTHDLSNAIQGVLGRVEVASRVARKGGDETVNRLLATSIVTAGQCARLIREIKQIGRVSSFGGNPQPRDLTEVLNRAVEIAEVPPTSAIQLELPNDMPGRRVLGNELLSLAIAKLIEEIAGDFSPRATPREAKIVVRSDPGLPDCVILRFYGLGRVVA